MVGAMLAGGGLTLAGVIAGRFLPGRRRKEQSRVEAICGCKHHHSYHDPATGACNYAGRYYIGTTVSGRSQYETRECTCKRYSGPEPLPEVYAPEISQ